MRHPICALSLVGLACSAPPRNVTREVEFLASLKKTFGLSDNQMDVAMKTASLFPAVDLGGMAPD